MDFFATGQPVTLPKVGDRMRVELRDTFDCPAGASYGDVIAAYTGIVSTVEAGDEPDVVHITAWVAPVLDDPA